MHQNITKSRESSNFQVKLKFVEDFNLSHDIIHEGSSVTSGSKVLLRTDVLTDRTEYRDFACLDSEREDYLKSIEYFREAERNEWRVKTILQTRFTNVHSRFGSRYFYF